MSDRFSDRLSRVSALRPAHGLRRAEAALDLPKPGGDRLSELLGGEDRFNHLGRHLSVDCWFADSSPETISPCALRRIFPNGHERLLDPRSWLFLDTETTGLAGGTGTYAFLVGIAWWENGGLAVKQFFMRDYDEEPSLLLELAPHMAKRRVLVTFNGKSFDWPLLQTRYRITRAASLDEPDVHLDLLHPSRRLWGLRLKSVALSELERNVLGLERGYDIDSGTIPQRYFEYLRGGVVEPMVEVFKHNQMDLRGLASLAVHITDLLHAPEDSQCQAEDLLGIARLLMNRGEEYLAGRICRRALESGLPEPAERRAQRDLAVLARRQKDFGRANELWGKLLGETPEGLRAYEQQAIHYEHRAQEPERAARLTREALMRLRDAFQRGLISPRQYQQWHASFQHRLNRLTGKLG